MGRLPWHGSAGGKRGRSRKYSEAAIQFCRTIKALCNLALRQVMGMAQSLLKLVGLDCSGLQHREPPTNASCRDDYREPDDDGTALTDRQYRYQDVGRGGVVNKEAWCRLPSSVRKVHLGIDAKTLEIRAIEVTDNATGDAPMLPCLLDQIGASGAIASVSGDGSYDTKACPKAIALRGAQAITPTRKDGKPWKPSTGGLRRATPYCVPCGTWVVEYGRSRPAPSTQSGGNQNALFQAARRASDGARFRRPCRRVQVHAAILNRFT